MSVNTVEVQRLRDERMRAHAAAVSYLQQPTQTSETRSSYESAMSRVDELRDQIQKLESGNSPFIKSEKNPWHSPTEHQRAATFAKYLRQGKEVLDAGERRLLEKRDQSEGNLISQIGTYTGLGYFVPAGFVYDIEQATKYFAPLLDGSVCKTITTATGNPLPYPTSNDTSQQATVVGENTTVSEQDLTASHVPLGAWKLSSGVVKISLELIQDSAFDLESWLAEQFAIRYGRGLENYFTNGTGVNQPTGMLTDIAASGAVPTIAVGSSANDGIVGNTGVNSIGYTDLVNLEHSVDPTYRRGAKYMMHDQSVAFIKKILDKFGRPLWVPGIAVNAPDTVLGYPVVVNQSLPQIGASNVTVIYGDFSKFLLRKVQDMMLIRLDQTFATAGQVGFVSFMRVDSRLIDAGTHPLNALQQHS